MGLIKWKGKKSGPLLLFATAVFCGGACGGGTDDSLAQMVACAAFWIFPFLQRFFLFFNISQVWRRAIMFKWFLSCKFHSLFILKVEIKQLEQKFLCNHWADFSVNAAYTKYLMKVYSTYFFSFPVCWGSNPGSQAC